MNWHEFLELASMQFPKLPPNLCPLNLLRLSLVRKMHHLSPKSKRTKRSVPNPPRSKISRVSWTKQSQKILKLGNFFLPLLLQPHSLMLSPHLNLTLPLNLTTTIHSNLVKVNLFWESADHPKLSAGKDGVTNPDQTCQYCKDMRSPYRELSQASSQGRVSCNSK